jgi:hypothetical protein
MTPVDLLALVEVDLRPCRLQRRDDTAALVTAPDGTAFDLTVEIDRRKLMALQEVTAHVTGPVVTGHGAASLILHHTGQVRRTGLTGRVRGGADDQATALRDRLVGDVELQEACLPLDVTRFRVVPVDGRWQAQLRLLGGSHVRTRIPPGGSYVRLATDQRDALLATVRALYRVLPGVAPEPVTSPAGTTRGGGRRAAEPSRATSTSHLPSRGGHDVG